MEWLLINRTASMRTALFTLLVVGVCFILLQIIGNPSVYFQYDIPKGQFLYVLSKTSGFCAVFLLGIQIVAGVFSRKLRLAKTHRLLGTVVFLMVCAHAVLFVTAVSMRSGHFVSGLLMPDFSNGFYNAMVSLGVLGFWGVVLLVLSGALRLKAKRIGALLHKLAVPVFFLAGFHALQIGTETRNSPLRILLAIEGLVVAIALAFECFPHIQRLLPVWRIGRQKNEFRTTK